MYLNKLEANQKKLFLEIAHKIVVADGEYSDSEKMIIQSYCKEMDIVDTEYPERTLDEILVDIKECFTKSDIKIIIFELIGLCMVDGKYDNSEIEFIQKVCDEVNEGKMYCEKCEKYIKEYIILQERINALVMK